MKRIYFHVLNITLLLTWGVLYAATPGNFNLIQPSNNGTNVDLNPVFSWYLATNASSYKLQISETNDFSSFWVAQEVNIATNSVTLSSEKKLLPNSKYFWRIIAYSDYNNKGDMKSSEIWSFATKNLAPAIPTLSQPANGATDVSTSPVLSWNGVSGATSYRSQVRTTNSFDTYNYVDRTELFAQIPNLTPGTTYYWRVGAENSYGFSGYSEVSSFTTKAASSVTAPTLISPVNNASGVTLNPTLSWSSVTGANSYTVEVSYTTSFAIINLFLKNEYVTSTNFTLSGLDPSKDYYWRVTANGYLNSATSGIYKFKTLDPSSSAPTWPRGSVANIINSPFGPRNASGNSWFHRGMDMGGGQTFVAPFNMKCVYAGVTSSSSYLRLVFENTETGGEPKHVQFEECNKDDVSKFSFAPNPPTTYSRGQTVATQGAEGPYVHMEAFQSGTYSGDWTKDFTSSRNPLQWWQSSPAEGDVTVEEIVPLQATNVVFPQEGNKRYFELYIRQKRTCMALNKIKIALTDNKGRETSVFLEDPVAATIDFNHGVGVERQINVASTSASHLWLGGAGQSKMKNGVKIFTKDVNATVKDLVFRYYLTANTAFKPTEIDVELFDAKERVLASKIDWRFEGVCVDCPGGSGPMPPNFLSAVQYDNGIRLEWSRSPDYSQDIVAYKIYRRPIGATYNPQTIAVVPATKRVFYDRFDTPGNELTGGVTYLYSIASVGKANEGCNGPSKINCSGKWCPLTCVDEKSVLAPLPLFLLYENKKVFQQLPEVKAKYNVKMANDKIFAAGKISITAGYTLDMNGEITIENGALVNLKVDPSVQ